MTVNYNYKAELVGVLGFPGGREPQWGYAGSGFCRGWPELALHLEDEGQAAAQRARRVHENHCASIGELEGKIPLL